MGNHLKKDKIFLSQKVLEQEKSFIFPKWCFNGQIEIGRNIRGTIDILFTCDYLENQTNNKLRKKYKERQQEIIEISEKLENILKIKCLKDLPKVVPRSEFSVFFVREEGGKKKIRDEDYDKWTFKDMREALKGSLNRLRRELEKSFEKKYAFELGYIKENYKVLKRVRFTVLVYITSKTFYSMTPKEFQKTWKTLVRSSQKAFEEKTKPLKEENEKLHLNVKDLILQTRYPMDVVIV